MNKGRIKLTSLNNFLGDKSDWEIVHYSSHERRYTNSEIVKRAYSRLDENEYNILFNNCEHFARWCVTGEQCSKQVNDAVMYSSTVGAVGVGSYAYYKYSAASQIVTSGSQIATRSLTTLAARTVISSATGAGSAIGAASITSAAGTAATTSGIAATGLVGTVSAPVIIAGAAVGLGVAAIISFFSDD